MGISHKLLRKALMPMAFVMIDQTSQKEFIVASVFRMGQIYLRPQIISVFMA